MSRTAERPPPPAGRRGDEMHEVFLGLAATSSNDMVVVHEGDF
ncbi:hypothetical protein [Streptomyces sp. RKAG290]|nr:hypothetical protein [Streptomyces sp. RKAG290]